MSLGIKIQEPTLSVNQEWKKDESNQFYTFR